MPALLLFGLASTGLFQSIDEQWWMERQCEVRAIATEQRQIDHERQVHRAAIAATYTESGASHEVTVRGAWLASRLYLLASLSGHEKHDAITCWIDAAGDGHTDRDSLWPWLAAWLVAGAWLFASLGIVIDALRFAWVQAYDDYGSLLLVVFGFGALCLTTLPVALAYFAWSDHEAPWRASKCTVIEAERRIELGKHDRREHYVDVLFAEVSAASNSRLRYAKQMRTSEERAPVLLRKYALGSTHECWLAPDDGPLVALEPRDVTGPLLWQAPLLLVLGAVAWFIVAVLVGNGRDKRRARSARSFPAALS